MKLVVDVDGVLADQVTPVLQRLNKKFGLSITKDRIRTWDEPIASTDIKTEIENSHLDAHFVLAMKPIQGASEAMGELAKKHEITIATSRHPQADDATKRWLKSKGISYDHYVNTSISGKEAAEGDILIDDYPDNVLGFADRGGFAILFDQPWNQEDFSVREAMCRGKVVRARGWQAVLQVVNSTES